MFDSLSRRLFGGTPAQGEQVPHQPEDIPGAERVGFTLAARLDSQRIGALTHIGERTLGEIESDLCASGLVQANFNLRQTWAEQAQVAKRCAIDPDRTADFLNYALSHAGGGKSEFRYRLDRFTIEPLVGELGMASSPFGDKIIAESGYYKVARVNMNGDELFSLSVHALLPHFIRAYGFYLEHSPLDLLQLQEDLGESKAP